MSISPLPMLDDNSTRKVLPTISFPRGRRDSVISSEPTPPPTPTFSCRRRGSVIPSEPTEPPTPPATPKPPLLAEHHAPPTSLQHFPTATNFITTLPWTCQSLDEYCRIRSILLLYWHIFNLVLEYERRPSVYHVPWVPTGWNRPFIITEVPVRDSNRRLIYGIGPHAHPPDVSLLERLARNKYNHCDFSIQLFLIYLEPVFKEIGATITWLAVQVKPYVVYHLEGEQPDPFVRHSVFNIRTQTGAEYIADFTMEQFGFNINDFLMHKRDYQDAYTTKRKIPQPRTEEVERARRGEFKDWNGKGWVVREVCRIVTLHSWNIADERTRLLDLEILVRQISARRWGWHQDYSIDLLVTCREHLIHAMS